MKLQKACVVSALFALTLTLTLARAADAGIEFSGVLTNDGHTKIALTDKATNTTTWLEPGDVFRGYTIARYDAKEDAVFVRKNGNETRLSLTASKISEGSVATVPTAAPAVASTSAAPVQAPPTEAAANAVRSNLRVLASAARLYQVAHGPTPVTYGELVGPGKSIAQLRPIAGETYANLIFPPTATTLSVTMGDGAPVSVDVPAAAASASMVAAQTPAPSIPPPPPAPVTAVTSPAPTPTPAAASHSQGAYPTANSNSASPNATPTSPETLEPTGRPPGPALYTTGPDESWESIAQKTGVPVQKLKELNSPIQGGSLPQGQDVRIR